MEGKENIDYVICPLCIQQGKGETESRKRFISPVHVLMHGLNTKEFRERFPNQMFKCELLRKNQAERLKGENHFNYGKHLSEEARTNISEGVRKQFIYDKCYRCNREIVLINSEDEKICKYCKKELEKPKFSEDTEEFVYCRICGLQKKNLTNHIVKIHKMTTEEYMTKYEVESVYAKNSRNLTAHKHFNEMSDEHKHKITILADKRKKERKNIEKAFKIEDYLDLIEKAKQQQLIDTDEYIHCRVCFKRKPFISPAHLWTHKLTSAMYVKIFLNARLRSIKLSKIVGRRSFETKIKNGQMEIGNCFGYGGYRKDVGHYVRSMNEANFARILKMNKVKYKYECKTFELTKSKFASYTPDFLLLENFEKWEKDTFVELKAFIDSDTDLKHEIFLEQYPEVKFDILKFKTEYWNYLEKKYKDQILLWENGKQNVRKTPALYTD